MSDDPPLAPNLADLAAATPEKIAEAGGCHVLTEETQQSPFFLEIVGRKNPGLLYCYHQEWVESLARAAEEDHRAQA